jgi:hypothetical protein
MRKSALFCAALLLASSTAAWAGVVVNVGDYAFAPGEIRTIPLYVTSDNEQQIMGMNFYVQIGDGGSINGGVDTAPIIAGVDVTGPGTIFALDHEEPFIFPDEQLMWGANVVTTTHENPDDPEIPLWGTVLCDGVFAFVTIDATGATPGQAYSLKLTGVAEGAIEGGFNTSFVDANGNELGSISNGSITIVPEPSAIGLLGSLLAAISVTGLRRRFVSGS